MGTYLGFFLNKYIFLPFHNQTVSLAIRLYRKVPENKMKKNWIKDKLKFWEREDMLEIGMEIFANNALCDIVYDNYIFLNIKKPSFLNQKYHCWKVQQYAIEWFVPQHSLNKFSHIPGTKHGDCLYTYRTVFNFRWFDVKKFVQMYNVQAP